MKPNDRIYTQYYNENMSGAAARKGYEIYRQKPEHKVIRALGALALVAAIGIGSHIVVDRFTDPDLNNNPEKKYGARVNEITSVFLNDEAEARKSPFIGRIDDNSATFLCSIEGDQSFDLEDGAYVNTNDATGETYLGVPVDDIEGVKVSDAKKLDSDKDGVIWFRYGDAVAYNKSATQMSQDDVEIAQTLADKGATPLLTDKALN